MKEEFTKNVLIIAGMHRSGTSMITSYLGECGIDLGDNLMPKGKENPKGYFEDMDIYELHREMMAAATENGAGGWHDVGYTEDGFFDPAVFENFKEKAQTIAKQKEEKSKKTWGWKEPRTALLLNFWEELLPDAKFLLIYRNPWEVQNSLLNTEQPILKYRPKYAIEIWLQYNKAILSFYEKYKDKCVLVSANGFLIKASKLITLINKKFDWNLTIANNDFFNPELFGRNLELNYVEECLNDVRVMEQLFHLDNLADISSKDSLINISKYNITDATKIVEQVITSNINYNYQLQEGNYQLSLNKQKLKELEEELKIQKLKSENYKLQLNDLKLLYEEKQQLLNEGNKKLKLAEQANIETQTKLSELLNEITSLKKSVEIQQNYNVSLNNVIRGLEEKIKVIENSRLWKFKRKYHKLKTLLRSSKTNLKKKGILKKVLYLTSKTGRRLIRKILALIFKHGYLFFETKKVRIIEGDEIPIEHHVDPWQNFLIKSVASVADIELFKQNIQIFSYLPKISIIMPVYNPPENFLIHAIESVQEQVYGNWELCVADDCSTNPAIKTILEKFEEEDDRIKVVYRKENGHISATSNSALEIATGEFITLLDHDDLITKDALYQMVFALNANKDLDMLYSDEDKIDEVGNRTEPHFKPDWCPDNFMARNYITHLACLRKSIVDEIGGFRVGYEGSQDYDLFLRFTEKTQKIHHIPRILYHWRMHDASTAQEEQVKPYAFEAGVKALQESLDRRGEKATATIKPGLPGFYTVRYDIVEEDKISIIIPTKDNAKVLETCLKSVFEKSTYKNFEVILIDNNSEEKSTFQLIDKYEDMYPNQFIRLTLPIPFNFSTLMNKAVEVSKGDYIVLLNNDTEIITENWMEAMLEQAQRESVGAVGVKLLYHNDTIQHAGVVIGLGGVAGHSFIGLPKDSPGYFYYITSTNNYSAVTAACLMVKKNKYLEVDGFNEDFSVEYNDVDFCLKLAEAGYNNLYIPYVELYHYESLTRGHPHMTKTSYERHIREVNLFKSRWQKYIDHDPCYNPNLTLDATHFQVRL